MKRSIKAGGAMSRLAVALSTLAVGVICLIFTASAHAAEEARTAGSKAAVHAPKAEKNAAARRPGDAIAERIRERAAPSEQAFMDVLLPLQGTWTYMASIWAAPGVEPQRSDGTMTNEVVSGRRFLASKALGSMNVAGQYIPFEGQGLTGYDNAKKSFASVWTDTMTTGIATGGGKFDAEKRVLTQTGKFTHPLTGTDSSFRSEIRLVDADHYTQTIFAADKGGKEAKLMEFEYTRKN